MIFETDGNEEMLDKIGLMLSYVGEHCLETFRETAKKDPRKAIEELPERINELLRAGNCFFSGRQSGGPFELVTAPMLNVIGLVYPLVPRNLRKKALVQCMDFLDKRNYLLAQSNVELMNEPWLVRDVIINSNWQYWCGFSEYADLLRGMVFWPEFEDEFIADGKLNCRSFFWLAYTVSRQDFCQTAIRCRFAEEFPELIERTKDAIAAFSWFRAIRRNERFEDVVKAFDPDWSEDLLNRARKEQWILL